MNKIVTKKSERIVPGDRICFPNRQPWLVIEATLKGGYVFLNLKAPEDRMFSFPVGADVPVRPGKGALDL